MFHLRLRPEVATRATHASRLVATRHVGGKVRDDDGGETEYRAGKSMTAAEAATLIRLAASLQATIDTAPSTQGRRRG